MDYLPFLIIIGNQAGRSCVELQKKDYPVIILKLLNNFIQDKLTIDPKSDNWFELI